MADFSITISYSDADKKVDVKMTPAAPCTALWMLKHAESILLGMGVKAEQEAATGLVLATGPLPKTTGRTGRG